MYCLRGGGYPSTVRWERGTPVLSNVLPEGRVYPSPVRCPARGRRVPQSCQMSCWRGGGTPVLSEVLPEGRRVPQSCQMSCQRGGCTPVLSDFLLEGKGYCSPVRCSARGEGVPQSYQMSCWRGEGYPSPVRCPAKGEGVPQFCQKSCWRVPQSCQMSSQRGGGIPVLQDVLPEEGGTPVLSMSCWRGEGYPSPVRCPAGGERGTPVMSQVVGVGERRGA